MVDPRPLAVARIGVGVAALLTFTEHYFRLTSIAEGDLAMPGLAALPAVGTATVTVYAVVALLASITLILGAGGRVAAAVVTTCAWFGFVWEQQTYSNHMMLIAWLALWLAVVPCDAGWSLSSRSRGRGTIVWGDQFLLMSQLSVCYFFAAVVKLNPGFLSGDALQGYVGLDLGLPGWAWVLLACGAVGTELGVALGLWLPRTKWLAAAAGVSLHLAITVAMWYDAWALVAFAVACLSQYPMFVFARLPSPPPADSPADSTVDSHVPSPEESMSSRHGARA